MKKLLSLVLLMACLMPTSMARVNQVQDLQERFQSPDSEASPWIFWYWMNGAVTKEGITADLEAMKEIGLEGTYLMPIRDSSRVQFMDNCVLQGTPQWWEMVEFSMQEADRLGLKMGMHICDGFALAGGPWIKPEQSMQKVVYSMTQVQGGVLNNLQLPRPEIKESYYRDIATYAIPISAVNSLVIRPEVTVSTGEAMQGLVDGSSKFRSTTDAWVQYAFDQPFTAASMTVYPSGTNFQSLRWRVAVSDDGVHFKDIKTCQPARRGWQDTDAPNTYTLPETTAKYFRFYWTPEGSEPGAEDLDAAKWKATLAIKQIVLNRLPLIENFEGKSGLVWRLSPRLDENALPSTACVALKDVINLTDRMNAYGHIPSLELPKGDWLILRMGHTSTGHRNETAGGGKGLECDKFNPEAVRWQYENWFGATYKHIDNALLSRVLKRMHVDSWECGSQNWTATFFDEFKARRGYDLLPYMPLYAGIPLESAAVSEAVLYDIRQTISDLTNEAFFGTLHQLAAEKGCLLSTECVAPTMMSDGLRHYAISDLPMGEFWLDSPTHDKPNDMFDAVSGAHIYGKNIVQAEGFTQLRALWKEHPGMLKTLGDYNLAFGMNKLFFHVFCLHPFPDKYPGMTLDGIGLYMHGSQTWWPYAKEWVDYFERCQTMLQAGQSMRDIAVFTGENLPSRSVLPHQLIKSLPGLFGQERVASEAKRQANEGQPTHKTSVGVVAAKNMVTADLWVDPLRGYQYDCINRDALIRLAKAENGRMVLPSGASYRVFVLPEAHPMSPDVQYMSLEVLEKIAELQQAGVVVLLPKQRPVAQTSHREWATYDLRYQSLVNQVWAKAEADKCILPWLDESLQAQGLKPAIRFYDENKQWQDEIAWSQRDLKDAQVWFVSNQSGQVKNLDVQLRSQYTCLSYWDPQTSRYYRLNSVSQDDMQQTSIKLAANGSAFIVAANTYPDAAEAPQWTVSQENLKAKFKAWNIHFRRLDKTLEKSSLFDWRTSDDPAIKYYSGEADYQTTFTCKAPKNAHRVYLKLEDVNVIASVKVNGKDCGIMWAAPYLIDVTDALKKGKNRLEIAMANTWYNYSQAVNYGIIKDENYWTNGRTWDYKEGKVLKMEDLQPSGLFGEVQLIVEK